MSDLTRKIADGIKIILDRASSAAAEGAPDQVVVQLLFDALLLSFIEEAPLTEQQLAFLAGSISRSGLHRLAGIADQARSSVVIPMQTPEVLPRLLRAFDKTGFLGFAVKDNDALVELLAAVADAKKLCGIDTVTVKPRHDHLPKDGQ